MAGSEALAAVSCCVVQRSCRSCKNLKRGTRSSEAPKADAKVRSTSHGTGRAGTATAKTVVLTRASVSSAAELRTAVKVARCPRARRRARRKSCSREYRRAQRSSEESVRLGTEAKATSSAIYA
eukprot:32971-Pleurochrysis_carterae.AAC.1